MIGPFIDTANLLFGDYSPIVMVIIANCLVHMLEMNTLTRYTRFDSWYNRKLALLIFPLILGLYVQCILIITVP